MTRPRTTPPRWGPRQLGRLARRLELEYGSPRHHNQDDPLDELVFILLSAKTSERTYLHTYERLSLKYPGWFPILDARKGEVSRLIKSGGLGHKKEAQLRGILSRLCNPEVWDRFQGLAYVSNAEAESFLCELPGIGLKSARCVLMYSLAREAFPVDTHCMRVLSRLGVVPFHRLTDIVQDEIQQAIPPSLRYSLHVNLVAHGRAVCTSRSPKCETCFIRQSCAYFAVQGGRGSLRRVWAT